MNLIDFSRVNRMRCESPSGFNHKLNSWSLSDWFTAVLGELGEAANVGKKLNRIRDGIRGNKETPEALREKLKLEIGDAGIYLDLLAQSEGLTLAECMRESFDRKSEEMGMPFLAPDVKDRAQVATEVNQYLEAHFGLALRTEHVRTIRALIGG